MKNNKNSQDNYQYFNGLFDNKIQLYEYRKNRDRTFNKVAIIFVVYHLVINLISALLFNKVPTSILDYGSFMIISTALGIFIAFQFSKSFSLKEIIFYKKKDASILQVIYLWGIGLCLNTIFSLIITGITDLFNIKLFDVNTIVTKQMSISMLIYIVVIGPLIEELLYRGLILRNLSIYLKNLAIIFTALIFSLSHQNISQSFGVLGIGFLISYIGIKYSFIVGLIIHILNNLLSATATVILSKYGLMHPAYIAINLLLYLIILFTIIKTIYDFCTNRTNKKIDKDNNHSIRNISEFTKEMLKKENNKIIIENNQAFISNKLILFIIILEFILMFIAELSI